MGTKLIKCVLSSKLLLCTARGSGLLRTSWRLYRTFPRVIPPNVEGMWDVYTPTPWQVLAKDTPSRINSPAYLISLGTGLESKKRLQVESLEFTGGSFQIVQKNAEGMQGSLVSFCVNHP